MLRTYKRKLILTKTQEQRLSSWIGACRVVYNLGMEVKNIAYKEKNISVNKFELSRQLPELRNDIEWIKDVPSDSLQSVLERLDFSYSVFFRSFKKGGGYPKFASKKLYKSITFKQSVWVRNNIVSLPKIGKIKMFKDSGIKGKIKRATIVIEPTGFFICICCNEVDPKFFSDSQVIGLDMGISNLAIDSSGNFISNPKHFKKYDRRLRIENRSLARKIKGSNSWNKQSKKLSLFHHKIKNVRKDFLHKESTNIAKKNGTVYIENLNIKGMAKNKNLSKSILDCGWGMFKYMLSYKTTVIKIDPKYTSQTCNECGNRDSNSRISQEKFICTFCGHVANADINAAKNILSKGIALSRERESLDCALTLYPSMECQSTK